MSLDDGPHEAETEVVDPVVVTAKTEDLPEVDHKEVEPEGEGGKIEETDLEGVAGNAGDGAEGDPDVAGGDDQENGADGGEGEDGTRGLDATDDATSTPVLAEDGDGEPSFGAAEADEDGGGGDGGSEEAEDSSEDSSTPQKETADFMRREVQRIAKDLLKTTAPLRPPVAKMFVPWTFHSYDTYCDVSAARIVIDQKTVQVLDVHRNHGKRPTALKIVEPTMNLRLDQGLEDKSDFVQTTLPPLGRIPTPQPLTRPPKQGSTLLPLVPTVRLRGHRLLANPKLETMQPKKTIFTKAFFRDGYDFRLNYPPTVMEKDSIRKLLHDRYENQIRTKRKEQDYEKTAQDFYRMKLDVMEKVLPENRGRMINAAYTYLSTTAGSKKAAEECLF